MTEAGKYYCGYEPCRNGWLQYGGDWFDNSRTDSFNEPKKQKSNNMINSISQGNSISSLFPFITI